MRLPLLHLRVVPPPGTVPSLAEVLRAPPVALVPVVDDAGVVYGANVQLLYGTYFLLACVMLLAALRSRRHDVGS